MMLDRLNLEYLQPLRDEVEEKIQHHIDLDKLERGELKQCPRWATIIEIPVWSSVSSLVAYDPGLPRLEQKNSFIIFQL